MLPRPDAKSFTKFVLSAGMLMLLASFVIPGLILRETGALRISRRTLAGLTPTGRQELERRQRLEHSAGLAAPYIGIALLAGGVALVALGVPRLKRQEDADRERATMELDKLRSELKPQTAKEREGRLEEDVAQEMRPGDELAAEFKGTQDERDASAVETEAVPAPGETGPVRFQPAHRPQRSTWPVVDGEPLSGRDRRLQEARDAEDRVLARLEQIAPPRYRLEAQVKAIGEHKGTGHRPSVLLDGVLLSTRQSPSVVVEIKTIWRSAYRNNLYNRINDAVAQMMRYRAVSGQDAVVWLILVLFERDATADDHRFAAECARDFPGIVHVTLTTVEDIARLSLPWGL